MRGRGAVRLAAAIAGLAPLWGAPAGAGGPAASVGGTPVAWPDAARDVAFYTDLGGLGPLSQEEAVAQTLAAFGRWTELPGTTASVIHSGSLLLDVDATSFAAYLAPNGTSEIIYDEDGAIFDLLAGPNNTLFGLALPTVDEATGELLEVTVFLNGGAIDDPAFPGLTAEEFLGTQVHELGHFFGLDHSVVNGESDWFFDATGPSPSESFPRPGSFDGLIESMYPFLRPGSGQDTPDADDRGALSALYPTAAWPGTTGSISGRVLDIDGRTPASGINVVARSLDDPFRDAVSDVSGRLVGHPPTAAPEQAGRYLLKGLTPGARYAVFVDQIFAGGFAAQAVLSAPEEFWNGASESDNFARLDPPDDFTALTAQAGVELAGTDVVLNRLRPGPIPLDVAILGRERILPWLELLLPFPFELCGLRFDRVFVNGSDGSLSLGRPEGLAELSGWTRPFLRGAPRIAALGTLLEPRVDDTTISFEQSGRHLTVRYHDVPAVSPDDFLPFGSNSFAITLLPPMSRQRSRARLEYGRVDAPSGIAGYSCGGGATSGFEPEVDLSRLERRTVSDPRATAVFEEFARLDNDLAGRELSFELPGPLVDELEPNDAFQRAPWVELPFDTAARVTDIAPGDVDYVRFWLRAGQTLVAETARGPLVDTQLALLDARGDTLASNDDLLPGSIAITARVIYRAARSGLYTLAVTTPTPVKHPGLESGRYVLSIDAYDGTAVSLGDDESVEVPLGFAFPFQGRRWTRLFVNSNGNVSFGAPETFTSVSSLQLPGFLAGPPRIAALFTDLDPSGELTFGVPGIVLVDPGHGSLGVHWASVPKVFGVETDSASLTLRADGAAEMRWRHATAADHFGRGVIVGVTPGGGAVDRGPLDLSRARALSTRGTSYEQFSDGILFGDDEIPRGTPDVPSIDLSFGELEWDPARER